MSGLDLDWEFGVIELARGTPFEPFFLLPGLSFEELGSEVVVAFVSLSLPVQSELVRKGLLERYLNFVKQLRQARAMGLPVLILEVSSALLYPEAVLSLTGLNGTEASNMLRHLASSLLDLRGVELDVRRLLPAWNGDWISREPQGAYVSPLLRQHMYIAMKSNDRLLGRGCDTVRRSIELASDTSYEPLAYDRSDREGQLSYRVSERSLMVHQSGTNGGPAGLMWPSVELCGLSSIAILTRMKDARAPHSRMRIIGVDCFSIEPAFVSDDFDLLPRVLTRAFVPLELANHRLFDLYIEILNDPSSGRQNGHFGGSVIYSAKVTNNDR